MEKRNRTADSDVELLVSTKRYIVLVSMDFTFVSFNFSTKSFSSSKKFVLLLDFYLHNYILNCDVFFLIRFYVYICFVFISVIFKGFRIIKK